jgi:glycosyltransferase involved in cell wall biosynthesis
VLDGGDGARFRAAHGLGDRPIVLFVGRKQRYKGFHALYEAMSAVTAAIPGATLVAAGRPGETLPNATAPEGYLNLGECSEMEKADALAACDVFCMPSVGEAFGIAYVDAWSYAKPVVTGPAPAPLELLRASGAGLSAQQDPRAVADALIRLLGDREYGRALGRKGLDYQKQHWTWDRVWTLHAQAWRRAA